MRNVGRRSRRRRNNENLQEEIASERGKLERKRRRTLGSQGTAVRNLGQATTRSQ